MLIPLNIALCTSIAIIIELDYNDKYTNRVLPLRTRRSGVILECHVFIGSSSYFEGARPRHPYLRAETCDEIREHVSLMDHVALLLVYKPTDDVIAIGLVRVQKSISIMRISRSKVLHSHDVLSHTSR